MRRVVLIIILLVIAAIVSYDFYSSGKVMYLESKNEILEYKLNSMIDGYEKNLDKYMRCWEVEDPVGIWECYIDSNLNRIKPIAGVRYVAVNNINGKLFWDYWPMKYYLQYGTKEASFNKNNIETYISKNSYKYIKYGYSGSEYIKKLPQNSSDKKIATANWTVYYWFDKRDNSVDKVLNDINSNVHNARKTMALICVLYIAIAIYLISFLVYIKRFGIKGILIEIKTKIRKIKFMLGKLFFWNTLKKLLRIIEKIFVGSLLRRIVIVVILSIAAGTTSYNFYKSRNYENLKDRNLILKEKLHELSQEYNKAFYKYTNYFWNISDGKIKEKDFEKHDFSDAGKDTYMIRFVIIDNRNGNVYWDYWALANMKIYKEDKNVIDKNIEGYVRKNSQVYNVESDGSAASIPSPKYTELTGAQIEVSDLTIYYWIDKRDAAGDTLIFNVDLKIEKAHKIVKIISILVVIDFLYLILFVIYIKKFGIKKFIKSVVNDAIQLKENYNLVCEKLSFQGPYKKSCIIFMTTIIFYLLVKNSLYPDGEATLHFLFIIFVFALFLLSLKKIKYFKFVLEYTEKLSNGNLSLNIEKNKDSDMDKLTNSINSIKLGYEEAFKNQIKTEIAKTELIANVSHDLKTPLTSILSYADLIKRDNLSLEEKQDYMKIVDMKTEKLSILINDLIEVSEVNNGKIQLHKEEVDIIALIYQVIGECSNYHEEKKIKFKVKSFDEKVMLCVDGKRMSRLIGNVISNSIKYSMPNTNVYVEIKKESDQIIIAFKSISENEMQFDVKEIFERFKRGDESRNSKVEGSGLGLAIAKGIAELHGGRMYAEKEGDMFKMYLILKQDLEAD